MPTLNTSKNCFLEYQTSGTIGPWVTLINGHTRSSSDFRMFSKHLVKSGFRTLVFDNRGSGKTRTSEPFLLSDMRDDVLSLWQEIGIEKSHVIGISMGGWIAQTLSQKASDRIISLTLISTSSRVLNTSKELKPWGNSEISVRAKLEPYLSDRFISKNKILFEAMVKQIAKSNVNDEFDAQAGEQRNAIRNFQIDHAGTQILCRTLIIHGSDDRVLPLEEATLLANLIPNSRLSVLEGMGHLLLAEDPKTLYESTTEFIRSC